MIDGGRRLAIAIEMFIPATSLSFSKLFLPETVLAGQRLNLQGYS
jgi:hypothetical protein